MRLDHFLASTAWLAFLCRARIVGLAAAAAIACAQVADARQVPDRAANGTARQAGLEPGTETPSEAYARLVRALREVESTAQGASPRADFRRLGGHAPGSQAQLEALRRITRELIEVLPQLPRRELDYSQGFSLLLPHLAESRTVARALAEVGADALRSGDALLFRDALDAQRACVADSAQDDILISSLVAMSVSRHAGGTLREALSSGLLDADAARSALEATESLAAADTYRIGEAIALEGSIVASELSRLRDMAPEARAAQFQQLTGSEQAALDDAALEESLAKAPAYFEEARAAMSNPDRAQGRAALEALEARAQAGEFGSALTVLAASYTVIQQRLVDLLAETRALRADLAGIASGEKPAEAFMNAAELYVAAGRSLRALDADTQRDIEAMRVAGDGLPADLQARTLASLRATRMGLGDRLLRAARCGRCDFAEGAGAALDIEATFLIDGVDGLAGAVRLMLVEPLVDPLVAAGVDSAADSSGDTPVNPATAIPAAPAAPVGAGPRSMRGTPADRVVAALIALRRYADGRAYGRSLVAQQIARDCADALERYHARGMLDDDARTRIAETLATLDRADPFGFARALPRERERLAQLPAWLPPTEPDTDPVRVNPFAGDAAKLPPHAVAFVLGMCTPLAAIDPASPEATIDPESDRSLGAPSAPPTPAVDGPFSDLRGWFDLPALREANGQRAALRERLVRDGAAGSFPLAGLAISRPVDIDQCIAQSQRDLERLDEQLARLARPVSE